MAADGTRDRFGPALAYPEFNTRCAGSDRERAVGTKYGRQTDLQLAKEEKEHEFLTFDLLTHVIGRGQAYAFVLCLCERVQLLHFLLAQFKSKQIQIQSQSFLRR